MRLIILGKLIEKDLNEAIEMADKRNIVIMGKVEPDLHAKLIEVVMSRVGPDGTADIEMDSIGPDGPVVMWRRGSIKMRKTSRRMELSL
jgi:hypothetical protein